jgi:hypothetical protein
MRWSEGLLKKERDNWSDFLLGQIKRLKGYVTKLKAKYSDGQVGEVVEAAMATGKVIKDFYEKRMNEKDL